MNINIKHTHTHIHINKQTNKHTGHKRIRINETNKHYIDNIHSRIKYKHKHSGLNAWIHCVCVWLSANTKWNWEKKTIKFIKNLIEINKSLTKHLVLNRFFFLFGRLHFRLSFAIHLVNWQWNVLEIKLCVLTDRFMIIFFYIYHKIIRLKAKKKIRSNRILWVFMKKSLKKHTHTHKKKSILIFFLTFHTLSDWFNFFFRWYKCNR